MHMEAEARAAAESRQADRAGHSAQHERGAGDWSNYQPPSAVLAAVAQVGAAHA